MKLTNLTTTLKHNAVKLLAAAALAGAVLAAPAAQAQRVRVFFGGPRFYRPAPPVVYAGPGFYGHYGYWHRDWRYDHHFDHRGYWR